MADCYSVETLGRWLRELSSSELATVATHVSGCAACQARLDAETDKATLRSWLEIGPDGQINQADLAVTEKLLSEPGAR